MQTAVLTEPGTIELQDRERPTPDPDEVLVRIHEVGICGSDVHYFEHGRIGDFVVDDPLILGHESAGEVAAVGTNVSGLSVGDRVAIEPGVPCRTCEECAAGRYHLCPDITFMATPPDDGAFAEFVTWPADFVYPLSQGVTLREGALCEPLSVGLHAADLAEIDPGDSVLITGAGPIGLVGLEVVRAAGATAIYVTDVVESKLDRARDRGARLAINVAERDLAQELPGDGVDVVIEASGAPGVHEQALSAVAPGGTVVCVGLPAAGTVPLDIVSITNREITLQGSFRYSNTYRDALSLLASGSVDVAGLIDDTYPLEDIHAAFDRARDPDVVKVMVTC